ncbi:MAG: superoxide dismutase [Alphaproteobacteria bacterium]|nr:superoxide dismutase [Alphaproteobacteria bacterium]MCD8526550.1 superoxide dismutase [Alphaproteobacteria bacterium]MCD8571337.1 superoxide dismutase [Alphaproteobacteria bacterium]
MTFTLPELPYAYDALAPFMSAETLEFHHDKHHKAYVDKGNELIAGTGKEGASLEKAMVWAFKNNPGLFNQLGQHFNHIHFWNWMTPSGGGTKLPGNLESAIKSDLGGYDEFRGKFVQAGMTQFGSGWCWLALDNATGKLEIVKTPNGENPVVHGKTALLGCDVWEHSYYIDYRNARQKYLEAFVDSLVNWDYVGQLFEKGPLKIAA